MAPNNFKKEEKYSFPNGPLPPGYIFRFAAFRQLDKGQKVKLLIKNINVKKFIKIY